MNPQAVETELMALADLFDISECNGNYTASLAGALCLLGKPLDDYTVGDLRRIIESHANTWRQGFRYSNYLVHMLDSGKPPLDPDDWEELAITPEVLK